MSPDSLNLMQLRAFINVVDHGSVSKAAAEMLRAQPVVTRALHSLEQYLAVPLFERHPNGMLLTSYGKCILPRARRVMAELATVAASVGHTSQRWQVPPYLLHTRRLEIFVRLCEMQHMQTVARLFGLSQPAISSAVKVLESDTGCVLFDRAAQGLKPTRTGLDILMPIRRALNEARRVREDICAQAGALKGKVRVGALPLGRTAILPSAVAELIPQHPGVQVVTNESPFEMLALDLRAGDLDFIFGALRPSSYASDLIGEQLLTEQMVVLVGRGHPLVGRQVGIGDLKLAQWILPREGSPARELFDANFHRVGSEAPPPVVETGDLAMIRGLLMRTHMLAAVSEHQLQHEISSGELVRLALELSDTHRAIGLTTRANGLHSPAAAVLMALIRRSLVGHRVA